MDAVVMEKMLPARSEPGEIERESPVQEVPEHPRVAKAPDGKKQSPTKDSAATRSRSLSAEILGPAETKDIKADVAGIFY